MNEKKNWVLKGIFYECCRVEDGHCALWFGRDLPTACANMATYQITEGHIQNIDMKGVVVMLHQDGIGPSSAPAVARVGTQKEEGQAVVFARFERRKRGRGGGGGG